MALSPQAVKASAMAMQERSLERWRVFMAYLRLKSKKILKVGALSKLKP